MSTLDHGQSPATTGAGLTRRAVFLWVGAIILVNHVVALIARRPDNPDFLVVSFFVILAWYAIARLLLESDRAAPADGWDIAVGVGVALLLMLPNGRIVWIAGTVAAAYLLLRHRRRDAKLTAAATVLAALSAQQLWSHLVFGIASVDLLRFETAAVGSLLGLTHQGMTWHDNIITGADGHGIAIYSECSSFHNLSLALLCWVGIAKLNAPTWRRSDFPIGMAVAATIILMNLTRLYLMALNIDLYHYWHDGIGAQIFGLGASMAILSVALFGLQQRTAK